MTDKSDVAGRLRARADEQERNNSYPVDRALDREAADEIDRLTAALASERERADGNFKAALAESDRADVLRSRVKALEETLLPLTNSADGMSFREDAIRNIVGNTNWRILRDNIAAARSALKETKDG